MFMVNSLLECILYGNLLQNNLMARVALTALYFAVLMVTYFMLFFNSFVGFRWIDDGSCLSLSVGFSPSPLVLASVPIFLLFPQQLLYLLSLGLFTLCLYIGLDAGLGISGAFSPPKTTGIFVIFFFIPIITLLTYTVAQTILCVFVIHYKRPLGNLSHFFPLWFNSSTSPLFLGSFPLLRARPLSRWPGLYLCRESRHMYWVTTRR